MKIRHLWPSRRLEGTPIGVDVGAHSIKVAQLAGAGTGPAFRLAAVIECAGDSTSRAASDLRRYLKSRKTPRPWRAVSSLPGPAADVRILSLPAGNPASLPQRVMAAAEKALPFGTEDTILDFCLLGCADEKTERVLLAAAPREVITGHLEFLRAAGMEPEAVELSPWALTRATRFCGAQSPSAPYGVLDVGHDWSTIIIFDEQGPFLSRPIRTGSRSLTERLSEELNLDWPRAEQLKGERGLTLAAQTGRADRVDPGGTLVAEILDDLLLPALEPLVTEVENSLTYFAIEASGGGLERLLLVGGGARLRNLDLFLGERLGLAVRALGPEQAGTPVLPDDVARLGGWPVLATAAGLSLRGRVPEREKRATQ